MVIVKPVCFSISTVRCFYLQQMLHLLSVAVPSIHFFIRRTQFPIPCQHILAMEVFLFCMCSAQDRCVTQKHTCFSFCPMPLLASCLANLTLFCIDFMLWVAKFSIDFFFDEKEMAPVVSFIWKEKSPIIEKLVTSNVTLLNAQCNNSLAQGQRSYLEHMLWVGKPLTLR